MSTIDHCKHLSCLTLFVILMATWPPANAGMEPPWDEVFTYQGQLKSNGAPFTGTVAMEFSLWNQASGGSQVGSAWSETVNVQEGLFSTEVYIASADWTDQRFLQIIVDGATLGTRQRINPAPTSMFAFEGASGGGSSPWTVSGSDIHYTAGNVAIGNTVAPERLNVTGNIALTGWLGHALPAGTPLPLVVSNQTAMRYISGTNSPNVLGGHFQNQIQAGTNGNVIGGGGLTGSVNSIQGSYNVIGGGAGNANFGAESVIGGGFENFIPSSVERAVIAGGFSNHVAGDWGSIGGGWANLVTTDYGTIAGGQTNGVHSGANHSFIGGGMGNMISQGPSPTIAQYSAIAGGEANKIHSGRGFIGAGEDNLVDGNRGFVGAGTSNEATGANAAIVGGSGNVATQLNAFVGGGSSNEATGSTSMVVGGSQNIASGQRSFAAGRRAEAVHNGAFVWGDDSTTTVQSSANNQFTVQAGGGARFYSSSNLSSGVILPSGAGAWSNMSDRESKMDFQDVDARAVLQTLLQVPIMTWRYNTEASGALHMGPMAQDFHAAFGLGDDERRLSTVDVDGVALAAIQGLAQELAQELAERDLRIAALEAQLEQVQEQTEQRIAALESLLLEVRQVAQGGQ